MKIKNNLIIIAKYLLLGCLSFASFTANAKAASDKLPQVIVGQTSMTTQDAYGNIDMITYGSSSGNYAIYNTGDNLLSYDYSAIDLNIGVLKCYDYIPRDPATNLSLPCFIHNYVVPNQTQAIQAMSGTTYVDGKAEYQLPAIYLYTKSVNGDAVMPDFSNFAFWGKNLAQKNTAGAIDPASGASWALSGYQVNNKSQSSWAADTEGEYAKFDEKMQTLARGGTVITADQLYSVLNTNQNIYLQTTDSADNIQNNIGSSTVQNAKYPEGRVWVVNGSVSIPAGKTITYYGVGTIIINGNLVVGDGTKILPHDEKIDKLGIIVLGS